MRTHGRSNGRSFFRERSALAIPNDAPVYRSALLAAVAVGVLAAGCERQRTPPSNLQVNGLPVTGSIDYARRLGFARCVDFNAYYRCRREGVGLVGRGPFSAAVDTIGSQGQGGFHHLILWNDDDQYEVVTVGEALRTRGWTSCRTGTADRGDQTIWRKPGSQVRVSIDLSYWGKRRLRIFPEHGQPTGRCW